MVSLPLPMMRRLQVGQGLLIIEASRSHSDTPHSVGLLWTSDQPDAEPSSGQHSTRDRHPCTRQDSNPQSQQASGLRDRIVRYIPTYKQIGAQGRSCSISYFRLKTVLISYFVANPPMGNRSLRSFRPTPTNSTIFSRLRAFETVQSFAVR